MKLRFVTSPGGNYHMTEILSALCETARDAGCDASLASSRFPSIDDETAYVFIPHEHYQCEPGTAWPSREQRARTIALCVENPSTQWFELVCELAPRFPRMFAINRSSVSALGGRGIPAEHLQLGYVPHWDRWQAQDGERPIDVTYLGSEDPRRDALLAGYGRWLWRLRTAMLVPPLAPKPSARPDYLVDGAKYAHLSRCKVLVNLHREQSNSFEWVRVLQAIANGCVVVSEPSPDHAPLVPGEHFLVAGAESIPHVVGGLLAEPERLARIRSSAYEMVRSALDMTGAIKALITTAEDLVRRKSRHSLPEAAPPAREAAPEPHRIREDDDAGRLRAAVRSLTTETIELRRAVQRLVERSDGRDPDSAPELVALTPAYGDARPRVSVAITVYDYEREVVDALESVAASQFEDYEVLVLDDASSDRSVDAVRDFLADHPWMPAMLLRSRVNRGLGASRNALAHRARGEMMFVLDADNAVFPTTLERLVDALDRDPGAAFAYPLIAVLRLEEPIGLLSSHAWDPNGFAHGNYIDAMAMVRLDDLLAIGGYTEDPRLTGWEDFHLWCACGERGLRGTSVPEVLARYRKADHSMLGWTQTDVTTAWSLMRTRFPAIISSEFAPHV